VSVVLSSNIFVYRIHECKRSHAHLGIGMNAYHCQGAIAIGQYEHC
jgi:hypothetical protein